MTKKRLKITVDRDLCDAHGVCVVNAPSVFDIGDDDQMQLLVTRPDDSQMEAVHAAVRACPKGALGLVPDDD
ncbi:MAG TPA: ferredoxin [Polyangiaceae bacterium]